jgi:hypothetical protein
MNALQLYRLLLKQRYPPLAAREFMKVCERVEASTLGNLCSYFEATSKVKDIQATHFPTMTLAGEDLIKRAANRVGLEPPQSAQFHLKSGVLFSK